MNNWEITTKFIAVIFKSKTVTRKLGTCRKCEIVTISLSGAQNCRSIS